MLNPVIRAATVADVPLLLTLLHRAAAFQGEEEEVTASETQLAATMFGPRPLAHALLAKEAENGTPLGLACYYFTFSTYKGRLTLYLEDLFVEQAARGRGVGTALMTHLARIAADHDCRAIEWLTPSADDNAALPFYRSRIGGEVVETRAEGRLFFMRLGDDGIRRLSSGSGRVREELLHRTALP